jgi:hypothetical protein
VQAERAEVAAACDEHGPAAERLFQLIAQHRGMTAALRPELPDGRISASFG